MTPVCLGTALAVAGSDRDRFFVPGGIALGIGAILVLVHAARGRRGPRSMDVDLTEWFARWQVQHNAPDIDPSRTTVLRMFLTATFRLAQPLAHRGVAPATVTFAGLWLAVVVPVSALRWPALAAALCLVSSVLDGVDGAVAGISGRASRSGFVLDSVVDRLAEVAFFGALVAAGGDLVTASAAWAAVVLLEYTRARAGNAGLGEVGVVTIAERPTRVLCVAFGLIGAQVRPESARTIANVAALIAAGTAVVGLLQLARHLHHRFAASTDS